jgi:hypothetical protein
MTPSAFGTPRAEVVVRFDLENQSIFGPNHTSSEPRYFSAALYSSQLIVRNCGGVSLGTQPIYTDRFLKGTHHLVMQSFADFQEVDWVWTLQRRFINEDVRLRIHGWIMCITTKICYSSAPENIIVDHKISGEFS